MKLLEYQGKILLRRAGIQVPEGRLIALATQTAEAVRVLRGSRGVLKSQVTTGGREKAGGIKFFSSAEEAILLSEKMLGAVLPSTQPPGEPEIVELLLGEEYITYRRAFYLAAMVDYSRGCFCLLFHPEGGIDVEMADTSKLCRLNWKGDTEGLADFAKHTIRLLTPASGLLEPWLRMLTKVSSLFKSKDCLLLEVNPGVITEKGKIFALDCKMEIDDNALFRQPGILAEFGSSDRKTDFNFVPLDGSVGCVANGAGLAMASMDLITRLGGRPACFMDIGGRATSQSIAEGLNKVASLSGLRSVFINIFGGIVRCDDVARGILEADELLSSCVCVCVRMQGACACEGVNLLAASGSRLTLCSDMEDAARRSVVFSLGEAAK